MSQPQENEPIPMTRSLAPVQHGGLGLRQDMQSRAAALRKQSAMYSNSFVDLQTLAEGMAEARLLPQGVTPQAAAIIMLKAGELGIPPVSAFEFLYVIGNKVSLQGQMVMALVQRSGLGTIQVSERSAQKATAVGKRPGYEPLRITFTLDEAQKLGVKNIDKFPADMLVWKAVARVGRLLFADLLGGMDVADAGGNVIDSVADEGDYVVETPHRGGDAVPEGYAVESGLAGAPSGDSDVTEGSYTPLPNEPEPEYAWMDDLKAALAGAPIKGADIYQALGVANGSNREKAAAIDSWLNPAIGQSREAGELVKFVADWRARQS